MCSVSTVEKLIFKFLDSAREDKTAELNDSASSPILCDRNFSMTTILITP